MVKGDLLEGKLRPRSEAQEEWPHGEPGKCLLGKERGTCKGPEEGTSSLCLKKKRRPVWLEQRLTPTCKGGEWREVTSIRQKNPVNATAADSKDS